MTERHDDFICVCGDPDEKAAKYDEAASIIDEACERLSQGSASLIARPVNRENLLDSIVSSLHWDFEAEFIHMRTDQWHLVTAGTWPMKDGHYNPEGKREFETHIQCDRMEHGIAATWLAFAERFPEKLEEEH